MESAPLPIKDVILAQLDELQQTTQHRVRNLRFDQACVLFGIAFPYELDLTSIDVNIHSNWVTIQDEENMLRLEWTINDPSKVVVETYLDLFTFQLDKDAAINKTDVTLIVEASIREHLHGWGLYPIHPNPYPDSVVHR